jgi:hypothetical protein
MTLPGERRLDVMELILLAGLCGKKPQSETRQHSMSSARQLLFFRLPSVGVASARG